MPSMFSQRLFRFISRIALFAVMFATLAPSVSHAFAAQRGINSFAQEICTSDGKKITIQVTTTLGKQLATNLTAKETAPQPNIHGHLEHCPFCANPGFNADLPAPQALIIATLEAEAQAATVQQVAQYTNPQHLTPPAQAPPILL